MLLFIVNHYINQPFKINYLNYSKLKFKLIKYDNLLKI